MKPGTLFSIPIGGGRKRYVQFITRDVTGGPADVVRVFGKTYVEWDLPQAESVVNDGVLFHARVRLRLLRKAGLLKKEGQDACDPGTTAFLRFTEDGRVWTPNGPMVPDRDDAPGEKATSAETRAYPGALLTPEAFRTACETRKDSAPVPKDSEPLPPFATTPDPALFIGIVLILIGPLLYGLIKTVDGEDLSGVWALCWILALGCFALVHLSARNPRPAVSLYPDRIEAWDNRRSVTRVFPFEHIREIRLVKARIPAGKSSSIVPVLRLTFRGEDGWQPQQGRFRRHETFDATRMIKLSGLRDKPNDVLAAVNDAYSRFLAGK